ncbi:MAG TPA: hypothetical protein VFH51_11615, partial [Myxococcota bacterium]|nr:hypothetical protein [Myxococcota bacterium]
MIHDPQGVRGARAAALALCMVTACAEVPAGLSEVGEALPGNAIPTGGSGTTGGTTGASSGGTTGAPTLAGFALASVGTPGFCLQPSVWPVVGSTPLVAMPCTESAAQLWTWSATGFRLLDGSGCLSSQAAMANTPAVVTAACTSLSKFFMWDGLIYGDFDGLP